MPEVPLWFTAEVVRRLRDVTHVPGSLQHYARCPVPTHADRHRSFGFRPGDTVALVYCCQAGCSNEEIREALLGLGVPEENLGPLGTPQYEARRQVRATSDERQQIERLRWEMLELKATLRGLLSADLSLAMLKVRILAVAEDTDVPADRKGYVAFAMRAGVSQPRAYAAWKSDPLTQGRPECVSGDNVVLAGGDEDSQASQARGDGAIIEPRNPLSNRELTGAADPGDSRNENYRNENSEAEALEVLRSAGLTGTKPAA